MAAVTMRTWMRVLGIPTPLRRVVTRATVVAPLLVVGACSNAVSPADPTDIGSWMELYQVPGVSVAVIRNFEVAYTEVHGVKSKSTQEPVTERTLFQAASLSKGVSAVGVVRLAQEGVVSLDRDVNDYLTSWQVPDNAFQNSEHVTLRRLLSHTAGTTVQGFRGYRYTEPLPTLVQILNGEPPANSAPIVVDVVPGSRFRYSGGGYEVMDQAVRDVTGTTFPAFIRERVLEPIGMANSTFAQPLPASLFDSAASGYYADGTPVPGSHHIYPEIAAAALWTTPTDFAHFLIELQLSLRGESNRVLTQANTALLVTEVRDDYGLGFALRSLRRQPYFWHAGANDGFRGAMVAHRTGGHGVVIMTNSDNGLELSEAVIELIGKREGWPGY
ncbi:MAG: beta-lactamase family protein [Gemmatimonadota bacterium]|nr:beta-lactamase family protein [Gemmatimonadota bacterium]MDH3368965.1 beta-lactamase family protein [Gemmatimonadota bacterium]MDH3479270.1 beta-lactamase family protein [Gemmatimonadota bacterium]MDH3570589.1 beta-lactamase family protein [Gemmatimonadota bacterium]MDH5550575.1 beta-lactamase family protein [Gemmatimonadota bacterium]